MSRATANSRAVSGRHGSSTATWPRPIRRSASARSASGSLPSRAATVRASAAASTASANRFIRVRQLARSRRAQVASQTRPQASQPLTAASSSWRAIPVEPAASATRPRPWWSAGPADRRQVREVRLALGEPGLGSAGRPVAQVCPDAGDHERREQGQLADGPGAVEGVPDVPMARTGSPAQHRGLGQTPERWQEHLEPTARLARFERDVQVPLGAGQIAPTQRHESECAIGHRHRAPIGLVGDRLARRHAAASQSAPAQATIAGQGAHHVRAM